MHLNIWKIRTTGGVVTFLSPADSLFSLVREFRAAYRNAVVYAAWKMEG